MFVALLDTNVLWPSLQRDFILTLAAEGAYAPRWSSMILDELEHYEAEELVVRGASQAEAAASARRLRENMTNAFDDSLVENWEPYEGTFGLPDPDDEHVVAAALVAQADVIVTENLKDFPAERLPSSIRAIPAREFDYDTVRQHPSVASRAVLALAARTGRKGPRLSVADIVEIFEGRYGVANAVEVLSDAPGLREHLR